MVTNEVTEIFQDRDLLWKNDACLFDDATSAISSSVLSFFMWVCFTSVYVHPVSIILFLMEKNALFSFKLLMASFLMKVLMLGAVIWLYLPTVVFGGLQSTTDTFLYLSN